MSDTNNGELRNVLADFMEQIEEVGSEIEGTPTELDMHKVDAVYDTAIARITSRDQQIALAAQQNGVAWVVSVIDDLHIARDHDLNVDEDKLFKGIKNTIRDRYKFIVGVDPAPKYPVEATLKAQEKP